MCRSTRVARAVALVTTVIVVGCGNLLGDFDLGGDSEVDLPPADSVRIEPDSVAMSVGDTVSLRSVAWAGGLFVLRGSSWSVSDTTVAGILSEVVVGIFEVRVEARGVGATTVIAVVTSETAADTAIVIVQ